MRTRARLMVVAAFAILLAGLVAAPATAAPSTEASARATVATSLYRLYSPGAADHFYTTDWNEAVNAFNNLGYRYEGIQAYVWPWNSAGTTALYRLWSPGATDHFYTTNWNEAVNAFNNLGYRYEGIQAYVLP